MGKYAVEDAQRISQGLLPISIIVLPVELTLKWRSLIRHGLDIIKEEMMSNVTMRP